MSSKSVIYSSSGLCSLKKMTIIQHLHLFTQNDLLVLLYIVKVSLFLLLLLFSHIKSWYKFYEIIDISSIVENF